MTPWNTFLLITGTLLCLNVYASTHTVSKKKDIQYSYEIKCPGKWGLHPHLTDCSKYLVCLNGEPIIRQCPESKIYDENYEDCMPKENVICKTTIEMKCPREYGLHPHPTNCSKYLMCLNGDPYIRECPELQMFDKHYQECAPKESVNCDPTYEIKCPEEFGLFPYPTDCSKYLWCWNSNAFFRKCPGSQMFDINYQECMPKDNVTCHTANEIKCPREFGLHPHPTDCSKYLMCWNGDPYIRECPELQMFDKHYQECAPKESVNCDPTYEIKCPQEFGLHPYPTNCSKYLWCWNGNAFFRKCPESQMFDINYQECMPKDNVTCYTANDHTTHPISSTRKATLPTTIVPVTTTETPTSTTDALEVRCPHSLGLFPHPYDCSKYLLCFEGNLLVLQCRESQLFNAKFSQCLPKESVTCDTTNDKTTHPIYSTRKATQSTTTATAITTEAPVPTTDALKLSCPRSLGLFPHPHDCSKYLLCVESNLLVLQCQESQLFDAKYAECLPKEYVTCDVTDVRTTYSISSTRKITQPTTAVSITSTNALITTKVDCPQPDGLFPHPTDCSKYLICIGSAPIVLECRESQLFHAKYRRCMSKEKVTCDTSSEITCPNSDGLFPHPTDCSKYLMCVQSHPTVIKCRESLMFHAKYRRCLPKEKVTCETANDQSTHIISSTTKITQPTTTIRTTGATVSTTEASTIATAAPTTTTRAPTTTTRAPTTTTRAPTTTTRAPTTTTRAPTTTTRAPTTTTRAPTTTTRAPTTTTRAPTTTTPAPTITTVTVTFSPSPEIATKPNTPPPTNCDKKDLDCIIDNTGDVKGWFDCPEEYGHFAHGGSRQLFIHCDKWHPFIKKCPEGTVFSSSYTVCDWEKKL